MARRPIRVYGEMVGLLWRRNQTGPALALESLWNDLGRREQFSLFCSYPQPEPAAGGRGTAGGRAALIRRHRPAA